MSELENAEELNEAEEEKIVGGTLPVPNTAEVKTPDGYIALHSTPENVQWNEVPDIRLSNGDIVIKTEQVKNNMTYVYIMKNGANGWIDNSFLPQALY
ncbi:MAG: hypothetical protein IJ121_10865 [Eubacterium sp.]|nr:hypothetical protein [Eubacterium sp.]